MAAKPEYSLKEKPISPYFWRDHLACAQAIAIEYGHPPDVFATFMVNTAADSFPVAKYVQEAGCMELGADCYSHFKTLEYIVEGVLCGWRGER